MNLAVTLMTRVSLKNLAVTLMARVSHNKPSYHSDGKGKS